MNTQRNLSLLLFILSGLSCLAMDQGNIQKLIITQDHISSISLELLEQIIESNYTEEELLDPESYKDFYKINKNFYNICLEIYKRRIKTFLTSALKTLDENIITSAKFKEFLEDIDKHCNNFETTFTFAHNILKKSILELSEFFGVKVTFDYNSLKDLLIPSEYNIDIATLEVEKGAFNLTSLLCYEGKFDLWKNATKIFLVEPLLVYFVDIHTKTKIISIGAPLDDVYSAESMLYNLLNLFDIRFFSYYLSLLKPDLKAKLFKQQYSLRACTLAHYGVLTSLIQAKSRKIFETLDVLADYKFITVKILKEIIILIERIDSEFFNTNEALASDPVLLKRAQETFEKNKDKILAGLNSIVIEAEQLGSQLH